MYDSELGIHCVNNVSHKVFYARTFEFSLPYTYKTCQLQHVNMTIIHYRNTNSQSLQVFFTYVAAILTIAF
jgi:hypothetical protein